MDDTKMNLTVTAGLLKYTEMQIAIVGFVVWKWILLKRGLEQQKKILRIPVKKSTRNRLTCECEGTASG